MSNAGNSACNFSAAKNSHSQGAGTSPFNKKQGKAPGKVPASK